MARLIRSPPNVGGYYVQLPRAQYPVITLCAAAHNKYYLRVHDDLVDRARQVTARGLCKNLLQNCCSGDFSPQAGRECQA